MDAQKLAQITAEMTSDKWRLVPLEMVEVGIVKVIYDEVSVEGLINASLDGSSMNGDPFPHLVSIKHSLWVEDGLPRILVWRIRGAGLMPMRVLRVA